MQTVTTTLAATVNAKAVAIKDAKSLKAAKATKGLLVDGRPATFADLNNKHLTAAIDLVTFAIKDSGRARALELKIDAVQDALADFAAGTWFWDSSACAFSTCLMSRAKDYIRKRTKLKNYHRENVSYSNPETDSDGDTAEFNYAGTENSPLEALEVTEHEANTLAKFNKREQEYIKLVMLDIEAKEIAEIMQFASYGSFRKWRSLFGDKYNLGEKMDAQISKSAKLKQAKK